MEHTRFQLQISLCFLYLQYMSWMFIFLKPQGTSSRERWKSDCRQAKIICSNPLPPQGTSSGGRWKNDYRQAPRHQDGKTIYRQAKATFGGRWQKRLSASENHFFKPLPPQGTSSEDGKTNYRQAKATFGGRWKKNDCRQAKITFSSPFFKAVVKKN